MYRAGPSPADASWPGRRQSGGRPHRPRRLIAREVLHPLLICEHEPNRDSGPRKIPRRSDSKRPRQARREGGRASRARGLAAYFHRPPPGRRHGREIGARRRIAAVSSRIPCRSGKVDDDRVMASGLNPAPGWSSRTVRSAYERHHSALLASRSGRVIVTVDVQGAVLPIVASASRASNSKSIQLATSDQGSGDPIGSRPNLGVSSLRISRVFSSHLAASATLPMRW